MEDSSESGKSPFGRVSRETPLLVNAKTFAELVADLEAHPDPLHTIERDEQGRAIGIRVWG